MRTSREIEGVRVAKAMASAGVAGLLATWPMTLFMNWADDQPVESPHSRLPPREITEEMTTPVIPLSETEMKLATLAAHYGYGAAVGSLLPLTDPNFLVAPLTSGAVFGLGVWAGSYYGLLPALGSRASANCQSQRVNLAMVAAHIVWGASLGLLTAAIAQASTTLQADQTAHRTPS